MMLVHVVPHIHREASGPSYSVPSLCQALAARGHDVELSCLAQGKEVPGVTVDVHGQWPILGRFAVAPGHALALSRKAAQVDIVHNHSLWSMVNVAAGWVATGRRAKLVTSPRGTLSDWAMDRRRLAKQALWPLQRKALVAADLLHATSEAEYRDIRAIGLRAPVAIAPNGIDLPIPYRDKSVEKGRRTLLFLSRLHPTKGLERLFGAWVRLQGIFPDWELTITGTGSVEYVEHLREKARSMGLERVEFTGALYGNDKHAAYCTADLFVLPSHSENFGNVVAEALSHACPVVVSTGTPWRGVQEHGCGWWIENDVETLIETLSVAMKLPKHDLSAMGCKGRFWVETEFSWEEVALRLEAAYRWVVNGGAKPDHVRID